MNKLQSNFQGYRLTNQEKGHDLVIMVSNDMRASIVHESLSKSDKVVLEYTLSDEYFDLIIKMPLTDEYYELNYHRDEVSVNTAYAIDNSLIGAIWIGYPLSDSPTIFGQPIPF